MSPVVKKRHGKGALSQSSTVKKTGIEVKIVASSMEQIISSGKERTGTGEGASYLQRLFGTLLTTTYVKKNHTLFICSNIKVGHSFKARALKNSR